MESLTYENLLSPYGVFINGIGTLQIPTLKAIFVLNYEMYRLMINCLSIDLHEYLKLTGLTDKYDQLSEEDKKINTLFNLIMKNDEFRSMYLQIFKFFFVEDVVCDIDRNEFVVYTCTDDDQMKEVGSINSTNFELIRYYLLQVNYLSNLKPAPIKNERARRIAEKLKKSPLKSKSSEDMSFGKMISKYCADNKNGINMLNVFDLTIYQFYDQWKEHNYLRDCHIQDLVYANSANLKDLTSFDSQQWLKTN